ncbi:metal-dependent hydrolase [Thalassotalea psychrophila]|uniref:Metal-dependent hydrolase n=1 Tax=Thalassotalea psychrophila TaxID=3065647 RepID=A0ABY9TQS0_9GAMM|nr:metal-dependent hydrolase [Colwelliaceae bacterium SQ149]
MDALTHAIVGAAIAQLPRSSGLNKQSSISWRKRAIIGASAALFPDIDYLLFLINPLDFIAYWHRAETHSLLLAPLWAWLIMQCWQRFTSWQLPTKQLYWLCFLAITSHPLLDSLTTFGTQWFAPISRYRFAFNVLFVIDVYFSVIALCSLLLLIIVNHQIVKILALLLPACYLLVVFNIKHNIEQSLSGNQQTITLLPQPFSLLYWQAISQTEHGFVQTYIKLGSDPIAQWVSSKFGLPQQASYQLSEQLTWQHYNTLPSGPIMNNHALQVWQHPKFKAFHQFSAYPIFYDYQHTPQHTCVWFSDLRYHWPNVIPSFRYGMCRKNQTNHSNEWHLYRMKYFSEQAVTAN